MPFYQWDGTKLTRGDVYQWDGTNLLDGVVLEWPWIDIGPGPVDAFIDGGTPTTTAYVAGIDGGTPANDGVATDLVAAMPTPHFVAHRFGSQEAPQNTFFAAERLFTFFPDASASYHVAGECDLQALSDGTIVLHHDATIDFGGIVNVNTLTPAQWDTVTIASPISGAVARPAAFWDHPSYPEKSVATQWGGRRVLVPEIKDTSIVSDLITSITSNGWEGSVIVQSRVYSICQTLAAAGIYALFLTFAVRPTLTQLNDCETDGILGVICASSVVDATLIADAAANTRRVYSYNSNTASLMQGQIDLGVDGILSDKPVLTFPTPFPPVETFAASYDGGTP